VLTLEQVEHFPGMPGAIRVVPLEKVSRDRIILPADVLDLIDRNLKQFHQQRERLHELGMSVRKGVLFHGPPGTGKTYAVQYLHETMPDCTILLITAQQVLLLRHYMELARLLQPSIVVIEDVDLIARDRNQQSGAGTEVMLNELLNQMDGLNPESAVYVVLTTNHPEVLEDAIVSRPGRIDQTIEFPLPDAVCRERLARLYAGGVELDDRCVADLVLRTEGCSPAFIRELMRRTTQIRLETDDSCRVQSTDVSQAIDEILRHGHLAHRAAPPTTDN